MLYPAYQSYKTIKYPERDPEGKDFWIKYWVIFSLLMFLESFFGIFVSIIPFFYEAKAAFLLYLVLPRMKGAHAFYDSYVHQYLDMYEDHIDESASRWRGRTREVLLRNLSAGMAYLQNNGWQLFEAGHRFLTNSIHSLETDGDNSDTGSTPPLDGAEFERLTSVEDDENVPLQGLQLRQRQANRHYSMNLEKKPEKERKPHSSARVKSMRV
jgi:hypothetical protein